MSNIIELKNCLKPSTTSKMVLQHCKGAKAGRRNPTHYSKEVPRCPIFVIKISAVKGSTRALATQCPNTVQNFIRKISLICLPNHSGKAFMTIKEKKVIGSNPMSRLSNSSYKTRHFLLIRSPG